MRNRKPLIALLIVGLVALIGGTIAYFTGTVTLPNVFGATPYGTEVTEVFVSPNTWTPGTRTPKTVVVKNTGGVDVAVRASISETWVGSDGDSLSLTLSNNERAAVIEFGTATDWVQEGNYYYYSTKLAPAATTSQFIKSVTFNSAATEDTTCTTETENGTSVTTCSSTGSGYDGATYTLRVTIETVQYDAYTTVWNPTLTIS